MTAILRAKTRSGLAMAFEELLDIRSSKALYATDSVMR
jgi:hypothetical protein